MDGLSATRSLQASAQYTTLNNYVNNGAIDLDDALDEFCKPVEDTYRNSDNPDVESLLTTSWQAVITTAAITQWTSAPSQRLVDLLISLESRPDLEKAGQVLEVEGMTVWTDLPTFGWQMRAAWNVAADDDSDQQHKRQWIDLNGFTASLVAAAHKATNDRPDFSLYCIWTVRQALEDKTEPSNTALAAAAAWFAAAAPVLWDMCHQGKTFQGKVAAPGSRFKDQGWTGFSRDRWRAWTQRFSEIQGQISDETTAQLVQEARQAMGDVVEQ